MKKLMFGLLLTIWCTGCCYALPPMGNQDESEPGAAGASQATKEKGDDWRQHVKDSFKSTVWSNMENSERNPVRSAKLYQIKNEALQKKGVTDRGICQSTHNAKATIVSLRVSTKDVAQPMEVGDFQPSGYPEKAFDAYFGPTNLSVYKLNEGPLKGHLLMEFPQKSSTNWYIYTPEAAINDKMTTSCTVVSIRSSAPSSSKQAREILTQLSKAL